MLLLKKSVQSAAPRLKTKSLEIFSTALCVGTGQEKKH